MKINNEKIVNRFNDVMDFICCEHVTIGTRLSELEDKKEYYQVENGISIDWMISEAEYWLSCYHESGNVRCDDRFIDEENYKIWVSETGKLKRLIARLEKMDKNIIVAEW